MKKVTLLLAICLSISFFAPAQILPIIPKLELGVKGGVNLSQFVVANSAFSAGNRAGYLGGIWARFAAAGITFQPELYLTGKNVRIKSGDDVNNVKFTSIDVPFLIGTRVGALGLGGRFYAGPLVSFAINKDQTTFNQLKNAATLTDFKNQNLAFTLGGGFDIGKISADLRYEAGLTLQKYNNGYSRTRVSMFNVSLAYKLFQL